MTDGLFIGCPRLMGWRKAGKFKHTGFVLHHPVRKRSRQLKEQEGKASTARGKLRTGADSVLPFMKWGCGGHRAYV